MKSLILENRSKSGNTKEWKEESEVGQTCLPWQSLRHAFSLAVSLHFCSPFMIICILLWQAQESLDCHDCRYHDTSFSFPPFSSFDSTWNILCFSFSSCLSWLKEWEGRLCQMLWLLFFYFLRILSCILFIPIFFHTFSLSLHLIRSFILFFLLAFLFLDSLSGLNGIELGMQMIREVTRRINEEFPGITQFSTLSPIPGFRHYLLTQVHQVVSGSRSLVDNFFREEELMSLEEWLLNHKDMKTMNVWEFLAEVVKSNSWIHDQELSRRLRGPMMRKCAHYLFREKEEKGYAVNPVGECFFIQCLSCISFLISCSSISYWTSLKEWREAFTQASQYAVQSPLSLFH